VAWPSPRYLQDFGPRTVAVRDGEASVNVAAEQFGIAADAVNN
jgi:hypothetical protein